ncbi:MAG: hypothetical protein QGH97_15715 [Dehalococcoidia bacterium]|nr:hypothetical protein [Dehalococcoidia bacterium]HJN88008.1 hypothetical protein [Dehalococcoidia bacterium]
MRGIAYWYLVLEIRKRTAGWIKYLETVEGPYYDENERLIEERLGEGVHPTKYPGSSRAAGLDRTVITMGGN